MSNMEMVKNELINYCENKIIIASEFYKKKVY